MKKLLLSMLLALSLSGCYVYGGTSGYIAVEPPPLLQPQVLYTSPAPVVVYPEYYTVAPVCCNIWFGGRWHHSHHHWNHGYHRGWHHDNGGHRGRYKHHHGRD